MVWTKGQSSTSLPVGSSSDCQIAPVTLEVEKSKEWFTPCAMG